MNLLKSAKAAVFALVAAATFFAAVASDATITKFRVGKGDTSQSYAPNCIGSTPSPVYVKVTWPNVVMDSTGGFSSDRFTAQSDGTLIVGWNVWNQAGVTNTQGGGITAKVLFNGLSDTAAIGSVGEYLNTATSPGTMAFDMKAGDYIEIWNYAWPQACGTNVVVDGNNAHTWWWGVYIPAGQ